MDAQTILLRLVNNLPPVDYGEPLRDYHKGETLRLAARALHRQARKRFPDCPYPPKKMWPWELPFYEEWFEGILKLYDDVDKEDLTRFELAADERWVNALINAEDYNRKVKAKLKDYLLKEAGIDPYGHLAWGIGDEDDFVCLDWGTIEVVSGADVKATFFIFQSVVNSETGSFIMEYGYEEMVKPEDAVRVAIGMVDWAYEWCYDNEVEIDHPGWNYSGYRFVEDVKRAVGDTTTVTPFPGSKQEEEKDEWFGDTAEAWRQQYPEEEDQ